MVLLVIFIVASISSSPSLIHPCLVLEEKHRELENLGRAVWPNTFKSFLKNRSSPQRQSLAPFTPVKCHSLFHHLFCQPGVGGRVNNASHRSPEIQTNTTKPHLSDGINIKLLPVLYKSFDVLQPLIPRMEFEAVLVPPCGAQRDRKQRRKTPAASPNPEMLK